jgi:hypothetical protein
MFPVADAGLRHLVSIASCFGIERHLDLAHRLGLIGKRRVDAMSDEVVQIRKMVVAYRMRVLAQKR